VIPTAGTTEQKAAWNAKTYKRYQVYLRKDEDAELIQYLERNKNRHGTTELFRIALENELKKALSQNSSLS
jgi:hypothetical protein